MARTPKNTALSGEEVDHPLRPPFVHSPPGNAAGYAGGDQ